MTIWERVSNLVIKKILIYKKLIHNKKYVKAEKRFNTKESFQCFFLQLFFEEV